MGSPYKKERKLLTDFYMWMVENEYDHNIRIRVENKAELFMREHEPCVYIKAEQIISGIKNMLIKSEAITLKNAKALEEVLNTHVLQSIIDYGKQANGNCVCGGFPDCICNFSDKKQNG